MKIQSRTDCDLFYVVCSACLTKMHNEYLKSHHIRTCCPTRGQTGFGKLDELCWSGLPGRTAQGHIDRDKTPDMGSIREALRGAERRIPW